MVSIKRKEVDKDTNGAGTIKKTKKNDDDSQPLTLQYKANKSQGPDDEALQSLFDALSYAIRNLSLDNFKGAPYINPRKQAHKDFFDALTSDCKTYLTSKHHGAKPQIIQAAIWNKLIERLLRSPTNAFLVVSEAEIEAQTLGNSPPNMSKAEGSLTHAYADVPEEFYAWRSVTAHFLSNNFKGPTLWGEDGPRRADFIKETAALLNDLPCVRDGLEDNLDGIADKAFELAKAMACSRAGWVCMMKDFGIDETLHGFRIQKDRMEETELWNEEDAHSKSTIVDLISVPMLLKLGNSNGEDYDTYQVFRKAKVVMRPKKDAE